MHGVDRRHPSRLPNPQHARAPGIAVIYQEPTVVPELSVAENLFLARQPRRFGLIDWARIRRESVGLLKQVDLHADPATPVRELGIGQRQLVEIARALDLAQLVPDEHRAPDQPVYPALSPSSARVSATSATDPNVAAELVGAWNARKHRVMGPDHVAKSWSHRLKH